MKNYIDLVTKILNEGHVRSDRTGTGTLGIFGHQLRFDLQEGFPLVTTKRTHMKSIIHELLWFLQGSTNVQYLQEHGVTIWDAWADEHGELGPIYGAQWRTSGEGNLDQITELVDGIKRRPFSRRHILSAWNVTDLPDESISPQQNVAEGKMALAPCHVLSQFYVDDGKLSCAFVMRSSDVYIGMPFNIASYALLTHMLAQQCDLDVGELLYTGHDVHIYLNHLDQATELITRAPMPLPSLGLNKAPSILDYKYQDFQIQNYESWPALKGEVAV